VKDLIQIRFTVPPACAGWRLDRFVKRQIPRLSRTRIQKMIRAQRQLGGATLRPATRVRAGEALTLLRPAPDEPDVPRHYRTVYEDEQLLVISKPAGLPVHATARFHRNTLTALLREQFGADAPRLAHRIDRETSGLLVLARTPDAERELKQALAARDVCKAYLAIVHGDPGPSGVEQGAIGPDLTSGIRIKQHVRHDGLPARTSWRRLARRGVYSMVEAAPHTGRQHQIRVHLGALGCPIVGDKLYGADPSCMLEYLDLGWTDDLARRLLLPRHALHAARLSFAHPATGHELRLEDPLPPDLQAFWDRSSAAAAEPRGSVAEHVG